MELDEQYQQWRRKGWLAVVFGILIIIFAIIVIAFTAETPTPDYSKLGVHLLGGQNCMLESVRSPHVASGASSLQLFPQLPNMAAQVMQIIARNKSSSWEGSFFQVLDKIGTLQAPLPPP